MVKVEVQKLKRKAIELRMLLKSQNVELVNHLNQDAHELDFLRKSLKNLTNITSSLRNLRKKKFEQERELSRESMRSKSKNKIIKNNLKKKIDFALDNEKNSEIGDIIKPEEIPKNITKHKRTLSSNIGMSFRSLIKNVPDILSAKKKHKKNRSLSKKFKFGFEYLSEKSLNLGRKVSQQGLHSTAKKLRSYREKKGVLLNKIKRRDIDNNLKNFNRKKKIKLERNTLENVLNKERKESESYEYSKETKETVIINDCDEDPKNETENFKSLKNELLVKKNNSGDSLKKKLNKTLNKLYQIQDLKLDGDDDEEEEEEKYESIGGNFQQRKLNFEKLWEKELKERMGVNKKIEKSFKFKKEKMEKISESESEFEILDQDYRLKGHISMLNL